MPLTLQQRDEFFSAGFMRVHMGFSPAALARMQHISAGHFTYVDTSGTRRYRMHDLVARGHVANESPLAAEFLNICEQVCVSEIFADVLGLEPHELTVSDIFLVRMSPGDEIAMHTHTCTISAAMLVLADTGGVHVNVHETTRALHKHVLQPGWAMINLGRTPHAVEPVRSDRISLVWNAICPNQPTLGRPAGFPVVDSRSLVV
jgi:hypothetical protein